MKIEQRIRREGDNIILTLIEHPSGKVMGQRVWEGAGKYVRPVTLQGHVTIMVPERSGIDIKPARQS